MTPNNTTAEVSEAMLRLIVAARHVVFDGHFDGCSPAAAELLKELDEAGEAFAATVPWEDEPDA